MKKNKNYKKINTSLEFRTNKEENGHRRLTFGLFFGIGIVMLTCVCLLLLLKEYDFNIDNIIGRSPETTAAYSTTDAHVRYEGRGNFLLVCSDDDGKKIHHIALVSVDVGESLIEIHTLDESEKVEVGGYKGNLSKQLAHGGMTQLAQGVETLTSMPVTRYIRATEGGLKSLVRIFGGVPCVVKEQVSYKVDGVGYIIEAGEQTLTSDMSFKYMYYLSQQNTNKPDEMSEFLSDMLRTFLTAENLKSADSVYRKLVNILDTDISAFDFTSNKPKLESIIDDLKVEIVRKS